MYLHILSDIHLEFLPHITNIEKLRKKLPKLYTDCEIETKECILILAGDIGDPTMDNYWTFLKDCSSKYKYVIFIIGNHEYYNKKNKKITMNEKKEIIHKKLEEIETENLFLLDNNKINIDGIDFIGSTLWTYIPKNHENYITNCISDYKTIYTDIDEKLTPEVSNIIHNNDVEFLKDNITSDCVIITHHLPTDLLIDSKYKIYGELNHAFYTNLEHIFTDKIKLWVCGHTHTPKKCEINNIKCIANPIGYENENSNSKIVEICI